MHAHKHTHKRTSTHIEPRLDLEYHIRIFPSGIQNKSSLRRKPNLVRFFFLAGVLLVRCWCGAGAVLVRYWRAFGAL
jgi:hypothetical protein